MYIIETKNLVFKSVSLKSWTHLKRKHFHKLEYHSRFSFEKSQNNLQPNCLLWNFDFSVQNWFLFKTHTHSFAYTNTHTHAPQALKHTLLILNFAVGYRFSMKDRNNVATSQGLLHQLSNTEWSLKFGKVPLATFPDLTSNLNGSTTPGVVVLLLQLTRPFSISPTSYKLLFSKLNLYKHIFCTYIFWQRVIGCKSCS
jgi:hypothetical protein